MHDSELAEFKEPVGLFGSCQNLEASFSNLCTEYVISTSYYSTPKYTPKYIRCVIYSFV
jgi:hypothetical protein